MYLLRSFLPDPASNGQLYLLDFTIDPLATLVVSARKDAATDYAGHASLASNEFRVTHCKRNPRPTDSCGRSSLFVRAACLHPGPFS